MSLTDRQEDLLIAVALTEFSVHYEQADPELAEHAWQLAADRLLEYDVEPREAVDDLFVNAIGEYDSASAELLEAGEYMLDVEADGDWEIEIRQPRATSGDSLPQSLEGDGPVVAGPIEFSGNHIASGQHSGSSDFAVHVFPAEGMFGELVFNEIGEYDGETTFSHDGIGWVDIEADGKWSLELE